MVGEDNDNRERMVSQKPGKGMASEMGESSTMPNAGETLEEATVKVFSLHWFCQ